MGNSEDKFMAELRQAFAIEAEEHLQTITDGLLELEKVHDVKDGLRILEPVYRAAHSLKGASRAVNKSGMERLAHAMESVLLALKRGEIHSLPEHFDVLQDTVGMLNTLLADPDKDESIDVATLVNRLQLLAKTKDAATDPPGDETPTEVTGDEDRLQPPPTDQTKPTSPVPETGGGTIAHPMETVRIKASKLDLLLLKAEEMLSVKQAIEQRASDIRDMVGQLFLWGKNWERISEEVGNMRYAKDESDPGPALAQTGTDSSRLLDFLEWNHAYLTTMESRLTELSSALVEDHRNASTMVDGILEDAKELIMIPASSLLQKFPKMVRDIARDQDKNVDLSMVGGDVAIDRRILEDLQPPLMHLLRNCVDHGIEKPEIRTKANKSPAGSVTVTVSKEASNRVLIVVSDDGAGIELDKVLESGRRQGVVSASAPDTIAEEDTLELIFKSGISTSPIITDLSGRGLGLAIVHEKVSQLGGSVSVQSTPGTGTTFSMSLPLTKATFRGTLVRVSDRFFVVPSVSMERVVRIRIGDVKTVENREAVTLGKTAVSLVRLHDVLEIAYPEIQPGQQVSDTVPALVLGEGKHRIAFVVDEIVAEQEVLVKSLGSHLAGLKCVSGATILGSGKIAPILNVPGLMTLAAESAGMPVKTQAASKGAQVGKKSIVVVEDSLTSRTLLKNILESSGFDVLTAVDGLDGFRVLKTEKVDLVVSDVEMPRMDGFELTEKIRADKEFSELPVVLVTARESREDRERGVEAGANAYIVKSSFDQSNLLGVVRTLI